MTDEFATQLARARGHRRTYPPLLVGSVVAPLGLVLIGLAWLGASRTPVLQEQVAYLISGGLAGVALVVVGSFLYFSHWQTEQLRLTQSQTAEVVRALDRLQGTVDRLASSLVAGPALVATPAGSISHRPECSVVRGRSDVRAVDGALAACRICQPEAAHPA